jgi:hypothetical protein
MVAKIAGQKVQLEVSVGEGRFAAYYQAPDGTISSLSSSVAPGKNKMTIKKLPLATPS